MSTDPSLTPGTVIGGRYRVDRVLGAGGMGIVVAATHVGLGERVAVKVLRGEAALRPAAVERFLREARRAVRIRGAHVVRVTDIGHLESGAPYLVMEHLEGEDLAAVIARRGALSVEVAVDYVLQACEAVAEAHAQRIVHRDLKPSNLFLAQSPDGSPLVKVLDFGISKSLAADDDEESLTASHATIGSPRYMSPEQVRASKSVDARTDVWSLGVILHELVSGAAPFGGATASALLAAIVADAPVRLRAARADVPAALEGIVLRCLEKDPASRFPSLVELCAALAPFAPAHPSPARVAKITKAAAIAAIALAATEDDQTIEDGAGTVDPTGTVAAAREPTSATGTEGWGRTGGTTSPPIRETPHRASRWPLVAVVAVIGASAVGLRLAFPAAPVSASPSPSAEAPVVGSAPTETPTAASTKEAAEPPPSASVMPHGKASTKRASPSASAPHAPDAAPRGPVESDDGRWK